MPKVMQVPTYPQQRAAVAQQPRHIHATAKVATRRMVKIGPMVLIACLILAIVAVLTIPMVVGGAAASSSKAAAASEAQPVNRTSYDSVQAAAESLGLSGVALAALPDDVQVTAAYVVDDAYLELAFTYGKDSYLYRTAVGSDDLSGTDYDTYTYTAAEELEGATTIGYAGVSEKKLNTAVWISGGYTHALVAESGVDATEMRALAETMA